MQNNKGAWPWRVASRLLGRLSGIPKLQVRLARVLLKLPGSCRHILLYQPTESQTGLLSESSHTACVTHSPRAAQIQTDLLARIRRQRQDSNWNERA